MLASIQLDHELGFDAGKVRNVSGNRILPTELESLQLSTSRWRHSVCSASVAVLRKARAFVQISSM
jgi:hypothetical protein